MLGRCTPADHMSRRALMKGALGVAGGGVVMNWGGLTQTALAEAVKREKKHCIYLFMNGGWRQVQTLLMENWRPTRRALLSHPF